MIGTRIVYICGDFFPSIGQIQFSDLKIEHWTFNSLWLNFSIISKRLPIEVQTLEKSRKMVGRFHWAYMAKSTFQMRQYLRDIIHLRTHMNIYDLVLIMVSIFHRRFWKLWDQSEIDICLPEYGCLWNCLDEIFLWHIIFGVCIVPRSPGYYRLTWYNPQDK